MLDKSRARSWLGRVDCLDDHERSGFCSTKGVCWVSVRPGDGRVSTANVRIIWSVMSPVGKPMEFLIDEEVSELLWLTDRGTVNTGPAA